MPEVLITVIVVVAALAALTALSAIRVIKQYERGVVLRLGRLHRDIRRPGLTLILPFADRLRKVNMQIVTMPVPAQEGITRDNVTVRVDAVVYFKVVEPADAVIRVENYQFAVSQMAQTSLRSIIGKSELDDLLSNREKLNQGLELMIDSPAVDWGVQIDRVEIKDVSLPDTMKRSMARQAEAHRERRARVINADAELQASKRLAEAAQQMSAQPSALQLRLLQTITAVAAEKNSTLVLPFPVELLRFLERAQPPGEEETGTADGKSADGAPDTEPVTESAPESAAPSGDSLPPDLAAALRDPALVLPELQVTGLPSAAGHAAEREEDEPPATEAPGERAAGSQRRSAERPKEPATGDRGRRLHHRRNT